MPNYKFRKLQLYDLHIHIDGLPPKNYTEDFFRIISTVQTTKRKIEYDNNTFLAAPEYKISESLIYFPLYFGELHSDLVLFDLKSLEEHPQKLGSSTFSHKTHVLIDAKHRISIIEYNHSGAKSKEVANYLQTLFEFTTDKKCEVSINPKIDKEFIAGINRFKTIKHASITITKPNTDWTEWSDHLTESASDSNAQSTTVEMHAGRNNSIKKDSGIIQFLKTITVDEIRKSIVENARIIGTRIGEEAPFILKLKKHIFGKGIYAKTNEHNRVDSQDILAKMHTFMSDIIKNRGK